MDKLKFKARFEFNLIFGSKGISFFGWAIKRKSWGTPAKKGPAGSFHGPNWSFFIEL